MLSITATTTTTTAWRRQLPLLLLRVGGAGGNINRGLATKVVNAAPTKTAVNKKVVAATPPPPATKKSPATKKVVAEQQQQPPATKKTTKKVAPPPAVQEQVTTAQPITRTPKPFVRGNTSLILLRHGQSEWNKTNQFTGWVDVPLTGQGEAEAREAGRLIRSMDIDIVYCSMLKRAIKTMWLALEEADKMWLPVTYTWRLNERHYGALQGKNKAEAVKEFGEEQVMQWRRSYDIPPPAVDLTSEHYPGKDVRYAPFRRSGLPKGESLQMTQRRFLPLWTKEICNHIRMGKKVLIVAHGNSLRALIQHLEKMSDEKIVALNVPTGVPLVYKIRSKTCRPVPRQPHIVGSGVKGQYLGDPDKILAAVKGVANQTKG